MDLKAWADNQSPFIKLADGESLVGQYIAAEEVTSRFDPKKKNIKYTLLVNSEEKYFENGSASVARQFAGVKENQFVKITRLGEARNTSYTVKVVADKSGEVSKEEADEINEIMSG